MADVKDVETQFHKDNLESNLVELDVSNASNVASAIVNEIEFLAPASELLRIGLSVGRSVRLWKKI